MASYGGHPRSTHTSSHGTTSDAIFTQGLLQSDQYQYSQALENVEPDATFLKMEHNFNHSSYQSIFDDEFIFPATSQTDFKDKSNQSPACHQQHQSGMGQVPLPHDRLAMPPFMDTEEQCQQLQRIREAQRLQMQKIAELEETIRRNATFSTAEATQPTNTSPSTQVSSGDLEMSSPPIQGSGAQMFTNLPSPDFVPKMPIPPSTPRGTQPVMEHRTKVAHNAIERKYRLSINDRINDLRNIVTGGDEEQGKKLQKAAVLRRSIEYIRHLESTNKRLVTENKKLKEKLEGNHCRSGSVDMGGSSPDTPPISSNASSPSSYHSDSSGVNNLGNSPPSQDPPPHDDPMTLHSLFSSWLSGHIGDTPRIALCVLMMVTLSFLPSDFMASNIEVAHGGPGRHLASVDVTPGISMTTYILATVAKLVAGWLCVGWLVAQSLPVVSKTSKSVHFWKHSRQAGVSRNRGVYRDAVRDYCSALSAVMTFPRTVVAMVIALVWQLVCFVYLHLMLGAQFVRLLRAPANQEKGKAHLAEVAMAMHNCHKSDFMLGGSYLRRWFLGFAAANSAKGSLGHVPAEFWVMLALECKRSFCSPISTVGMRMFLMMARNSSQPLPLYYSWMLESDGIEFLSAITRLKSTGGPQGSPLLLLSHQFLRKQLCKAYHNMLLPQTEPREENPSFVTAVKDFRWILEKCKSISLNTNDRVMTDSGFEDLTWWAAIGVVASTWLSGSDSDAQDVYNLVESVPLVLNHHSNPLPSSLLMAFRCHCQYRSQCCDIECILHLIEQASINLTSSVALPSEDMTSDSLWKYGQVLTCDWLLHLRLSIWESATSDDQVRSLLSAGYASDVDSLSRVANSLPSVLPRILLHKSCLSIIQRGNPLQTRKILLSLKAHTSSKRFGQKEGGFEHALGMVLAYKHLPGGFGIKEGSVLEEAVTVFKKLGHSPGLQSCHSLQRVN